MRILIPGDDGYSHAHYWRMRGDERAAPACGLATLGGACQWPAEPGTPWCNQHTHAWLANAKAAGYVSAEQIRWAAEQSGLPAAFVDALTRRWERFFVPPPPKPAPAAPAPSGSLWEPRTGSGVPGLDAVAIRAPTPAEVEALRASANEAAQTSIFQDAPKKLKTPRRMK